MRRIFNWQVMLGLALITLSASVYYIHYLVFRDARHIAIYLVGDIAFLFFELFLVTLVIHGLLNYREKKLMLKKLNMVIGAFFWRFWKILISWSTIHSRTCYGPFSI